MGHNSNTAKNLIAKNIKIKYFIGLTFAEKIDDARHFDRSTLFGIFVSDQISIRSVSGPGHWISDYIYLE